LIWRSLSPSTGVRERRQENIAKTLNRGTTFDLTADIVNRPGLFVRGRGVLAIRDNVVKRLGNRVSPFGTEAQRYVAGYPVGGLWERPILAMDDANNNGLLEEDEFVIGDSAVYVGTNIPAYEIGYQLEVGLFNWMRVNANFDYQGEAMQNRSANSAELRGNWDRTSSLAEQARAVITSVTRRGDWQNVTQFRFQSASVTVDVPVRWVRRFRAKSAQLSLQGNNLGLWTDYRGRDPSVNSTPVGEQTTDNGVTIPQPRSYSFQLRLGY
jgi:hypothetical protein